MDDLTFIKGLVQDFTPDEQQTESARRTLLDHIDASQMRDELRSLVDPVPDDTITIPPWENHTRSPAWRAVAIRVAVAASAIAVLGLLVVGTLNPRAADATLENLARAVEVLPNEALTDVAVARSAHTESLVIEPVSVTNPDLGLAGVVVTADVVRRHAANGIFQFETAITDITFITSHDAATKREIEDRMGGVGSVEILTTAAPDHPGTDRSVLSSDADTVYQQLMASIAAHDDTATPVSTQILDEIIGLHTTFVLTPSERAATIAVLAMVDDLSVTTDGTTVTVTSEYETAEGREVLTALFDGSGWLVGESLVLLDGVPGLTPERVQAYRATYAPPDVIP